MSVKVPGSRPPCLRKDRRSELRLSRLSCPADDIGYYAHDSKVVRRLMLAPRPWNESGEEGEEGRQHPCLPAFQSTPNPFQGELCNWEPSSIDYIHGSITLGQVQASEMIHGRNTGGGASNSHGRSTACSLRAAYANYHDTCNTQASTLTRAST